MNCCTIPDIDLFWRIVTTVAFVIAAGVGVYYALKIVWPNDKW